MILELATGARRTCIVAVLAGLGLATPLPAAAQAAPTAGRTQGDAASAPALSTKRKATVSAAEYERLKEENSQLRDMVDLLNRKIAILEAQRAAATTTGKGQR